MIAFPRNKTQYKALYGRLRAFAFRRRRTLTSATVAVFVLIMLSYATLFAPPRDFPQGAVITIPSGTTLSEAAEMLEQVNIIQSAFWLKSVVFLFGGEKKVHSGDYAFHEQNSVFSVARMITSGDFGLTRITITIPEGATVEEMAVILDKRLGGFNKKEFLSAAKDLEGYLFPDTYYFLPTAQTEEIIGAMRENFFEKITLIDGELKMFDKPLNEVIVMASLLEKEARSNESRRIISGILWKRITIGMPLQVDAVFNYIIGKNTFELTTEDLQVDSPYNTYRYKGLPPGPIANPGLDAIRAAITPIATDYLFYLHDQNGRGHYSRSFEEHRQNKLQYLD